MKKLFLFLMVIAAALAGCNQKPNAPAPAADDLVGIYNADQDGDGKITPFAKIEKESTGYILYEYDKGKWWRPKKQWVDVDSFEPVTPMTKADLAKEVKHPVSVDVDGVKTKTFAVIHVPVGWSDDGEPKPFISKTGYFALTELGPIDLQKQ